MKSIKLKLKYKFETTGSSEPNYSPELKLSLKLIEFDKCQKILSTKNDPISLQKLEKLELTKFKTLVSQELELNFNPFLANLIEDSYVQISFKKLKLNNDIKRLIAKYPELKQSHGSEIVRILSPDYLKIKPIEKIESKPIEKRINIINIIISYFLNKN